MARLVNDIVTRVFLNFDWVDISSDVRAAQGVTIQRGRKDEDTSAPPQRCGFTLNNNSGNYSELNPMGAYYEYLSRNNSMETSLRLAKDTATTNATNSWGSMDADADGAWTPYAWSTSGGSAGDYAKSGGKATHAISSALSERLSYLADFDQRDFDATMTFSLSASNITGGVVAADMFFRLSPGLTEYYAVRLLIATDESLSLDILDSAGTSLVGAPVVVSGITHTSSQALKLRAHVEGQTVRAKAWVATSAEPLDWMITAVDSGGYATSTIRKASGRFAIRSVVDTGNTNVPLVFSYDDIEIRCPLAYTEIYGWPQGRDASGQDNTVEIDSRGVREFVNRGSGLIRSAPRRFIPTDGQGVAEVQHYWPLEDGPLSTTGQPLIGDRPLTLTSAISPERVFGQGVLAPWLAPSVQLQGPDTFSTQGDISMQGFSAASGWMFDFTRSEGAKEDTAFQVLHDNGAFDVIFDVSAKQITVVDDAGSTVVSYPRAFDGGVHHIRLAAAGSGTIAWDLLIDGESVTGSAYAGTLGSIFFILFSNAAGPSNPMSIGHVAVYNGSFSTSAYEAWDAAFGFRGETAGDRMSRACATLNYFPFPFAWIGDLSDTEPMGPQPTEDLLKILDECAEADGGILYEHRSAESMSYRTRKSLYTQTSWATLSLANGELSPPWKPVSDTKDLHDSVLVKNWLGGEATVASGDEGELLINPTSGGPFNRSPLRVDLNLYSDAQLIDQGAWRVHQGLVEDPRYPKVVIELHRTQIFEDNAELYARLLDLDIGDQVTLADLSAAWIYEDADQIVVGINRHLTRFNHTLELVCIPASTYRVFELDASYLDDSFDADNATTLNAPIDSTQTSIQVDVNPDVLWSGADQPYDVKAGGEKMIVTAVSGASSPQTFTVVRSTNGVVKAHDLFRPVRLARPSYLGL
ncbi:hypothetical protein UK23_29480 [Lentzea aerocolonigenes]|uniref:Uncharacterized protein n=1 Tax=Lentzea aerocolonigenes TaxID=68170 RepID=A0A0F0GLS5_LENAE|nr:hypothetical protein [Lentzea aerocolonigenes]KJK44434.1 hypothetical protein UK23_29480 [Lentzea aerocolonigenes]